MKVNVKGHLWDLLAFRGLVPKRVKRIAKASPQPRSVDPVNALARRLHPESQRLVITDIKEETATTTTFRLELAPGGPARELAYFRAGQYLSLKVEVDGVLVTRPYSIASAPYEALGADGFYQLTLRTLPAGFVTPYARDHWHVGAEILSSAPLGTFYYEPLRDARKIVGLAGGVGITPFRSMARAIVHGSLDAELLLLYGSSDERDIVFYDELKELETRAPDKIKVVHVLSCDEVSLADCEQGFITADIIQKYADVRNSSFFMCGPQAMYEFVEKELATLGLPRRRIRREVFGTVQDITRAPGFPAGLAGEIFQLTVHIGGSTMRVAARATETILVAMERANLVPPSQCRSGECGFCRSGLVSGEVYISPDGDGRRAADKRFGTIHPCASYPLSDLELVAPRGA